VNLEATARCTGKFVHLAVRATNGEDAPVEVVLQTPYGSKRFPNLQPGKNAYQSFNTRATSIEGGTVTVTATLDGVTQEYEIPFEGQTCG